MTKQIQWPRYPLVEGYDLFDEVTASDVAAMVALGFDPSKPDWEAIKTELMAAGYVWPDDLCNIQCRRLVHTLRETRAANPSAKPVEFVPNDFQRLILNALDGRALKKQQLADEVAGGDGRRFYRANSLTELRDRGLVAHKHGLGFYRPNSAPK